MSDTIDITDFLKMDLRVARVVNAERHPDPKVTKLLVLTVDVGGPEPRTVLAGIAEHYEPETLVDTNVVIVANLAPRVMRGVSSQGMVLAASGADGKPQLLSVDAPAGTRVG